MAKEPFKDPFPNLHRPSLFAPKKERSSAQWPSSRPGINPLTVPGVVNPPRSMAPEQPPEALTRSISINEVVEKMAGAVSRGAVMGVSESLKPPKAKRPSAEKPSRGRPKSGKPRPWEGSGFSKSEYYRRQKALKDGKDG